MINNVRSGASADGMMQALQDQAQSMADDFIRRADQGSAPASAETRKRSGVWWIDRVLILLATVFFIMTVMAQLGIYFKKLSGGN